MKISREVKLGIFAVIVVVALIWSYNYVKGRNVLKNVHEYTIVYDRIDGLNISNPVFINGYKVGLVNDVYFEDNETGKLIVKMWMEKDFRIPMNSVAEIYSSDLMGSKSIRINLSGQEIYHNYGDTLVSGIESSLQEQVSIQVLPLKTKAENLLLSVDSVMAVIQTIFNDDFRSNFASSLKNIRSTIANLSNSTYTLDSLISTEQNRLSSILTNLDSITYNINSNNEEIGKTISNLSAISDSIAQANLGQTLMYLEASLSSMNEILGKIDRGEGTLGLLVNNDSLYTNLEGATRELELLLEDFRLNPKKYVNFSLIDFRKAEKAKKESSK